MISSTLLLTLAVQALLPLAVGLVTKKSTNPSTKAMLLGLLTGINSVCLGLLGGVPVGSIAVTAVIGLATSLGTHYGIYKPLGATEAVQNRGVKDSPTPPTESPAASSTEGASTIPGEADEALAGYEAAVDLSEGYDTESDATPTEG